MNHLMDASDILHAIHVPTLVIGRTGDLTFPIEDVQRTAVGIQIRAGLHTGEVELDGPDVRGIAVHIGARVASLAGPSEVLVTSTVKDLVAGAALE